MKIIGPILFSLLMLIACTPAETGETIDHHSKDSTGIILPPQKVIPQNDWEQFLSLFPEVTAFDFNEALFTANEGVGNHRIPFKLDSAILETELVADNGAQDFIPESVHYAVAKFVIVPNEMWGFIVLAHGVGSDGRNQDYHVYTMNKAAEILNKKTVASSHSWGGGFAYEEGHLGIDGATYSIKTMEIRSDYGESEERPYMAQAKLNAYRFLENGTIEDQSQIAYLPPSEEETAYTCKVFDGIELIEAPIETAKDWKHYNNIQQSIAWADKLGKNYAFFATESAEKNPNLTFMDKPAAKTLHAIHYYTAGGGLTTSWEMNDFEAPCEFDLFVNFLYNSIELSDVNQDGLTEISFMYSLGCISDVSPVDVKLMLYENGAKYALRGQSRISSEIETGARATPNFKVDKSFKKAPAGFQKFAEKQWARYDVVY